MTRTARIEQVEPICEICGAVATRVQTLTAVDPDTGRQLALGDAVLCHDCATAVTRTERFDLVGGDEFRRRLARIVKDAMEVT